MSGTGSRKDGAIEGAEVEVKARATRGDNGNVDNFKKVFIVKHVFISMHGFCIEHISILIYGQFHTYILFHTHRSHTPLISFFPLHSMLLRSPSCSKPRQC